MNVMSHKLYDSVCSLPALDIMRRASVISYDHGVFPHDSVIDYACPCSYFIK